VNVQLRDEVHRGQGNHQTTAIQPPLTRLAKNNEDERCVDEVIRSGHASMIDRPRRLVVGARVELPVDSAVNPRGFDNAEITIRSG
jgi:hypothetical protein